jgi:hypothetical protein
MTVAFEMEEAARPQACAAGRVAGLCAILGAHLAATEAL